MRLINVETGKLEEFFGDKIPPYAILSHTWGPPGEEVSLSDINLGNIETPGNGSKKLKGCCNQAKKDGLRYAWIDTCCIDRTNSVELGEAINSMFRWYRKAFICYAYLSDVPPGDNSRDLESKFSASRWFCRGWTLQELLAPEELRFYNQEWISMGTKGDISNDIETITGIPKQFLHGWEDLRKASVAQRMSWAAKRRTTREEDIAYCLLGIFDVTMPMIYGESSEKAFARLQQEIMKNTGDHSILAWDLDAAESTPSKSTDVLSAGILATSPSNFANCGRIVLSKQDATLVNTFDVSGGRLRVHLPLYTAPGGEIYGLLNCGPDAEQVVGIPLHNIVSGGPSVEYLRPQGHYPILLQKTASTGLANAIYIWMERQSKAHEITSRRYWLRIEGHSNINLKLSGVHPPVSWERGRALIAKATDSGGNITRQYVARFRTQGEGSRDVIVVLEFGIQGLQPQARCHVMTLSRDTTLEDLSRKLMYMRPEAFGKQTACNGDLNMKVIVKEEHIAQEPMFIIRLARASGTSKMTVDANWELQQADRMLKFVSMLQQKDQVCLQAERLGQQTDEKRATLDAMEERLAAVKGNLEELKEEQTLLEYMLQKGTRDMEQLIKKHKEVKEQQDVLLLEQESEIQQHLDEHETKQGPENWLEKIIKTQLSAGNIGCSLKDVGEFDSNCLQPSRMVEGGHNINNQTPLSWAASSGYKAIVQLLIDKGTAIEAKDDNGDTPLMLAAYSGRKAIVQLLIDKGAAVEAKNNDGDTPLVYAAVSGYKAIVQLLIDKGAAVETKNKDSNTPLMLAAESGHETVVQLLINKGAAVEIRGEDGNTPLAFAAENGHEAVVQLLIDNGAVVETRDNKGYTPLALAVIHGYETVTQLLIDKGAAIEAKDNMGCTPLTLAAIYGHEAIIELLIDKGATIEAKDNNGDTPLTYAASSGCKAIVQLLIDKGAAIEAKDNNGNTSLACAAYSGHKAIVQLLIDKGAAIEAKDKDGDTPLACAADSGHEAIVQLLIDKGATVEAKSNDGSTPLKWAVANGHQAVARLLIDKGAAVEAKTRKRPRDLLED